MPQFAAELNKDSLGRITSARYDTDAAEWLSDVGMHTKNDAGLWVPVSATDPMPAKLTGSLPAGTAEIGKVAPADSGKAQQLIAEKMDFAGKTAGQTYDNPHFSAYKNAGSATATFGAPSTFVVELTNTTYGIVATSDGYPYGIGTSVATFFAQHLFSFDLLNDLKAKGRIPKSWGVTELKAALKSVAYSWVGYGVGSNAGSSANGATAKLWNGTAWATSLANTAAVPSALSAAITGTSIGTYVDSNGVFYLLAHSTYPSDGSIASAINTDYVKLDVALLTDVLDTADNLIYDRATGMQKVLSTPANASTPLIIAPTMDFKGKTAGQVFDVPHVARVSAKASLVDPPSTYSTEVNATGYGQLASLDGANYGGGGSSVSGQYGQNVFSFDVLNALKLQGLIPQKWTAADLKAAIKSITWEVYAYGVGSVGGVSANGATLKAWVGGAWSAAVTNTASAPALLKNGGPGNTALDDTGKVHLFAHATNPADGTIVSAIYTDYVKLDVVLIGEYMMTDLGRAYDNSVRAVRTARVNPAPDVETIANAMSLAAGASVDLFFDGKGATQVWLGISIDQQPWTAKPFNSPWSASAVGGAVKTVPNMYADQATTHSLAYPLVSLICHSAVTTLQEALGTAFSANQMGVKVTNNAAVTATLTVKVFRVWR